MAALEVRVDAARSEPLVQLEDAEREAVDSHDARAPGGVLPPERSPLVQRTREEAVARGRVLVRDERAVSAEAGERGGRRSDERDAHEAVAGMGVGLDEVARRREPRNRVDERDDQVHSGGGEEARLVEALREGGEERRGAGPDEHEPRPPDEHRFGSGGDHEAESPQKAREVALTAKRERAERAVGRGYTEDREPLEVDPAVVAVDERRHGREGEAERDERHRDRERAQPHESRIEELDEVAGEEETARDGEEGGRAEVRGQLVYVEDEHLEERRAEPEGGRDEDQRRATAEADERGGERDQRPGRRDRDVADFVGRPALDDGEDPERERIHARERREGTEEHAQLGLALLDGLHELRSCPRLVEATRVPRADGRGEREGDRARDGRARVPADVEEPVGLRLVDERVSGRQSEVAERRELEAPLPRPRREPREERRFGGPDVREVGAGEEVRGGDRDDGERET